MTTTPDRQSTPWIPNIETRRKLHSFLDGILILSGRLFYYPYAIKHHLFHSGREKLHVGCGHHRLTGWINADVHPGADLIVFLEKRLPFHADSLRLIYTEHVLEHVSFQKGVSFLREARRVLRREGIIRIAMPDLDDLIDGYQKDWRRFDWVNWPAHRFIKTRAEMINIAFRWWGHQHLYNREELERALREAGFDHFSFRQPGESEFPDLRGLETRPDSRLIVDAVKS
jgi:predicted SAM-dependent methyltransferase